MDPYIDGIVPIPMSQKERDFLTASPFLVGNLRRVYAAYDEDGNDLSAWPARAADAIEAGTRTLQKLGARLAELLDEDQWAECEALLQAAGVTPNARVERPDSQSRRNLKTTDPWLSGPTRTKG